MRHHQNSHGPVSFFANVARLPAKGLPVVIEANQQQRAALAAAHDVVEVERYRAELLVTSWKRNGIRVEGRVESDIVQECVLTLEPVRNHIDEIVSALFLPEDSKLGRLGFETGGEIMIDPEGEDSPETFSGEVIDVGALAEQFSSLAIDPYPRCAGASVKVGDDAADDKVEEPAWQAKLRALASKS